MNQIDVSIIIVNFFSFNYTKQTINSVIEYSKNFSYEIIIVDNSNDEKEFEKLKTIEQSNIKILNPEKNLGFGKANNFASKIAKGKYLYFLNEDTKLINNAIFPLFDFLEKNISVGIVGSNLYTSDLKPNHSFWKVEYSIKNVRKYDSIFKLLFRYTFNLKNPHFNYTGNPLEIKGDVLGASLMISKKDFDTLNGFDEDIFLNGEESLLCFQLIHILKKRIFNIPASKIIHYGNKSNANKYFLSGTKIFYKKAFGDKEVGRFIKFYKNYYRWLIFFAILRFKFYKIKKLRNYLTELKSFKV